MKNELLIAVKAWRRTEITRRSLMSLIKNTDSSADYMIFMDNSPKELIEFVKRLGLPYVHFDKQQGLGTMTRHVFRYAMDKKYSFLYHADNDYVYSKGWKDKLMSIMKSDDMIGLVSGFSHPGAERFPKVDPCGIICYEVHATIGGSCLFRMDAIRVFFEKFPMEEVVSRSSWDWGVTLKFSKMYRVLSVEDSIVQHVGTDGVHKYIAGDRFIGEG